MRRNGHKYGAIATMVEGIRFQSKAEAHRYQELRLLEKAGEIKDLWIQPEFPLSVAHHRNGEVRQVCLYRADFMYRDKVRGEVVEDVKGVCTPVYKLKKKMVEAQYGIQITEIR